MSAGLPSTAVPTSIHCDHLIQAYEGAEADLKVCTSCLVQRWSMLTFVLALTEVSGL